MGEWLKPTDCKSVPPCEVRRFESFPVHHSAGPIAAQAVVAQLVERVLGKDEVTSSILVNGSILFCETMGVVRGPMTTVTASSLTLTEFERLYAASDRAYEYWHGEAVEKGMPTWLHGLLQMIVGELLHRAGYRVCPELDLRLDPQFAPRPDIAAGRRSIRTRYPTQPGEIEIVVEILSPDDAMSRVLAKCGEYVRIGIEQVYVADPESETAWQWNRDRRQLDRVETWLLTNGQTIALADVWRELAERR